MNMNREQKRVQVVSLKREGLTNKEISNKTALSVSGIQKIMRNVKKTNSFKDQQRSGRPPKMNERNKRRTLRILKYKEARTATGISKVLKRYHDVDVSRQTVARVLKSFGYACRVKKKKPKLTVKHKKHRLEWAKNHEAWTADDWRKVIWSDESKFNLFNSDGKEYYWTDRPSELTEDAISPTVKFGGGGIMVWGCITWDGMFQCFIMIAQ
jgi:transposase